MTTYTIEHLDDLPVILATWHADFDWTRDNKTYSVEMRQYLDAVERPVYYVFDLRAYGLWQFNDLLEAATAAAGDRNTNFHHDNVIRVLLVSEDEILASVADSMRSDAFGNANVDYFKGLDDALDMVRRETTA